MLLSLSDDLFLHDLFWPGDRDCSRNKSEFQDWSDLFETLIHHRTISDHACRVRCTAENEIFLRHGSIQAKEPALMRTASQPCSFVLMIQSLTLCAQ